MTGRILTAAVALAALVLSGQAWANAMVRSAVNLTGPQLRVSDVFSGAESDAVIGAAPAPGRQLVFDRYALQRIANKHGIKWYPRSRYVQAVVTRESRILEIGEIEDALWRSLVKRGMAKGQQIELTNKALTIHVATNLGRPYEIENPVFDDRSERATATLAVTSDAGDVVRHRLDAIAYTVAEVPVLNRRVRRGETIEPGDVIWKKLRKDTVGRNVVVDRDAVIGQAARRYLSPGRVLMIDDLEAPRIVRKGGIVTIYYVTGNLRLTAKARAGEDGAMDETIRVVNVRSNKTIEAVVRGPTSVVIPTDVSASN